MKKVYFILWWLWQLTWGCLMTIPGLLVALFCIIFLKGKPHKNGFSFIVEIGGNWGGLEIGAVALCGKYYGSKYFEEIRRHEFGHNMQQLVFGPFQLFFVWIPSAIRYWYRNLNPDKIHTNYDDIWFEGTATKLGNKYIEIIEEKL